MTRIADLARNSDYLRERGHWIALKYRRIELVGDQQAHLIWMRGYDYKARRVPLRIATLHAEILHTRYHADAFSRARWKLRQFFLAVLEVFFPRALFL